jgi:hypothetical protein
MYLLHTPLVSVIYLLSLRRGCPLLFGSALPMQLVLTTVCIGITVAVPA